MGELRPLILSGAPRDEGLVEQCTSPELRHPSAGHSRRSSWQDSSDTSLSSPTFSSGKRHSRNISAASSLSSSPPPRPDGWESHKRATAPSPSLPYVAEVAEDSIERDDLKHLDSFDDGFGHWSRQVISTKSSIDGLAHPPFAPSDSHAYFYSDSELSQEHQSKRRRSGDSFSSLTSRIVTRLPSLSKRSRERKRASMPASPFAFDREQTTSPTLISPRLARSRSSSRARSMFRRSGEMDIDDEHLEQQLHEFPSQIGTITEDEPGDDGQPLEVHPFQGLDITDAAGELMMAVSEGSVDGNVELAQPEELQRVSTPLLPALMADQQASEPTALNSEHTSVQSLHSLAVHSNRTSNIGTPQLTSQTSPALSEPSSMASLSQAPGQQQQQQLQQQQQNPQSQQNRLSVRQSTDISPILIADANDKWSDSLGHANFHIYPAPYLPNTFNRETCDRLMKDWQEARQTYSMHLSRTNTHFGATSQTYQMTERKWAEIDAQWKHNFEIVAAHAAKDGNVELDEKVMEPAPVARIPSISDPHSGGKFPTLGDEDVVGPMTQVAAPQPSVPPALKRGMSKRTKIMRIFGLATPKSVMSYE